MAEECLDKHCAVSVSSIKRAELGKSVSFRTATNICKFLNITLDDALLVENDYLMPANINLEDDAEFLEIVTIEQIHSESDLKNLYQKFLRFSDKHHAKELAISVKPFDDRYMH